MADKFSLIPIERLFQWIMREYEQSGSIFGISKKLFFKPSEHDIFRTARYGQVLETPLGTAAGPHTQLAQNIITAWLTGARYIELKTVQTLEKIEVAKPCINMEDEGYNREWSQELNLNESFDQYLNAWILIHFLREKFGWQDEHAQGPGFIFNMSLGYNLEGILNKNMQNFLDKMENCQAEKEEKIKRMAKIYPEIKNITIPDRISNNVTLSTMHGCPPGEIEDITRYLLEERGFHTSIKLNPTLLGKQLLREILNEKLGFDITVPDEAFAHDLKYNDALVIIDSLKKLSMHENTAFGLKLSNTLETLNKRNIFSNKEKMIYMSGRALHPITINLAARLQQDFNGELDISFCAGIDCFNVSRVLSCGLLPVTVCSDILKPGGCTRLRQYIENIEQNMKYAVRPLYGNTRKAALNNLKQYAAEVINTERYHKSFFPGKSIKTTRKLTLFDCIHAPCSYTCPTHQEVPQYMCCAARSDFNRAFEIILKTNPFPSVTGMVCDHQCVTKCTRINYDNPLQIREIKRFIAENHIEIAQIKPAEKNGMKVAIIGAGPSGLSCAYFLALHGFEVDVYEARSFPGGMAALAIPGFRLREEDINRDIRRIEKSGVKIHCNTRVDRKIFDRLRKKSDFIYVGVGAQESTRLHIPGEALENVHDALTFLSTVHKGKRISPGKRVAVIGGGNSAVDAARTAWRLIDKEGEVSVIYRRSRQEMPASVEEVEAALTEGIKLMELTTPIRIEKGKKGLKLVCKKMKLAEKDESGRRRPIPVDNSQFDLYFDRIIYAVGQQADLDFLDDRDSDELNEKNIFIGGDAAHGPGNLVSAIADGKEAAKKIMEKAGCVPGPEAHRSTSSLSLADHQKKAAKREYGVEPEELEPDKRRHFKIYRSTLSQENALKEAARCLSCDRLCNVCVSVCPNRANISYRVEPMEYRLQQALKRNEKIVIKNDGLFQVKQEYQVLNIADYCNECGNCHTFCPTNGAPYKDKPRLCLTEESFAREDRAYFIGRDKGKSFIKSKFNGKAETLFVDEKGFFYQAEGVTARLDKKSFTLVEIDFKSSHSTEIHFQHAAGMSVLMRFCPLYLFGDF